MKFAKVLENRGSTEAFLDTPVKKDEIKKVMKAALMAPSWREQETCRFYVITDDDQLATMKENCLNPNDAQKVQDAPVLIVACSLKGMAGCLGGLPVNEPGQAWGFFDLGMAVENLLLQAEALGLGTLLIGERNEPVLRKMLEMPDGLMVGPLIALGYPAQKAEPDAHRPLKHAVVFS